MQRQAFLGRTARPRWNLYETDGLGRDTYISLNNGGFWTQNIKEIKYTPNYPVYHNENYHSLGHSAAPFRYYSDGSGRDSYVLQNSGGLKKDFQPLSGFHLKDFLRTPGECVFKFQNNPTKRNGVRVNTHYVTKRELSHNDYKKNIQKGIIERLYTAPIEKEREFMRTQSQERKGYIPYLRVYREEFPHYQTEANSKGKIKTEEDYIDSKHKMSTLSKFEFSVKPQKNAWKTGLNFYKNTEPKPVFPIPKFKKKKLVNLEIN